MTPELKRIAKADRQILEHLFQYYLYDMSQFAGWPVSENGTYAYPNDLLPPYWEEADHHPYFIVSEGEVAGFSLIRPSPMDDQIWDMGQFFVLRKFRGKGVGRLAFAMSLRGNPGQWQVRVLPSNLSAYQFWKTTIGDFSGGKFSETQEDYMGLNMTFFSFEIED